MTTVDLAKQVIACSLAGSEHLIGNRWNARPIRERLTGVGVLDSEIEQALVELQVGRQKSGKGERWWLTEVPDLALDHSDRVALCGCRERPFEWRRDGGEWICGRCHPPVSETVERRIFIDPA